MSLNGNGISVVLMAFNEAQSLESTFLEILHELKHLQIDFEILIVDDGSTDGSGTIADQLATETKTTRVIHHEKNLGLGGVYRTGFAEARNEFITFFPADGQFPARIISQFLPLVEENDLVLGYLPDRKENWLKLFLTAGERLLYKVLFQGFPKFQGIFMIRRAVLQKVNLASEGRGWAIVMEMVLRVRNSGYRIAGAPTDVRPRQSGNSKVNNFRTIWSNFLQMLDLYGQIEPVSSTPFWILLILLGVFHFATMGIYPPPFVDEGWAGSRAWSFHETFRAFGPLDRGVFDRFPGYWTYSPWLPCFLQSVMYTGSERPELMPLRVLSVAFGLLLLIVLHSIFRRLGGAKAALAGVLVIGLSPVFLYSAHLARYDIMVAAFGFAALALSLKEETSTWRHFAAGLISAAAFETHPYGCIYAPICMLLYFFRHRWSVWKHSNPWMFVTGTAAGLAVYFLLHIARYPATWLAINKIAGSGTHTPPLLSGSLMEIYQSLEGVLRLALYLSPFLICAFVIALIYLIFQKEEKDRQLLWLLILFVIFPALMLKNQFGYYAILYVPILEYSGAYLLFRARHAALRIVIGLILIGSLVYGIFTLKDNHTAEYQQVSSELAKLIHPGEVVMGNQIWWFGLYEHPWYSWEETYYYRQFRKGASLEAAFLELRPQIFIIDAHVSYFIRDYPKEDQSYFAQLSLPAKELNQILRKYSTRRAEFNGGYYGKIQVIEFHWDH